MVKFSEGIPDDTPENTVRAISEILKEESTQLGLSFRCSRRRSQMQREVTIDIADETSGKSLRVFLSYVESHNLRVVEGTIGNGFISDDWKLELLAKDMIHAHDSPPFRWGLYRRQGRGNVLETPPTHILDGPLLRRLLREKLGRPLSS